MGNLTSSVRREKLAAFTNISDLQTRRSTDVAAYANVCMYVSEYKQY